MARCARCGHWRECRPLPEARGWLCVRRCYPGALRRQGVRIAEPPATQYDMRNGLPNTL